MTVFCPYCGSARVASKNYGRTAGSIVGTVAGAAGGYRQQRCRRCGGPQSVQSPLEALDDQDRPGRRLKVDPRDDSYLHAYATVSQACARLPTILRFTIRADRTRVLIEYRTGFGCPNKRGQLCVWRHGHRLDPFVWPYDSSG